MKSKKWFLKQAKLALAGNSAPNAMSFIARGLRTYPDDIKLIKFSFKLKNIAPNSLWEQNYLASCVIESPSGFAPSTINNLVHELSKKKRLEEARAVLHRAIQEYPLEQSLLRNLSDIYRIDGKPEEAVLYLTQLVERFSAMPEDWRKLAEALIFTHRLEDAGTHIQEALRLFPNNKYILALSSDICRMKGDRDSAIIYGMKLISNHPNSLKGYARVIPDYIAQELFDEAREILERGKSDLGQPGLAKRLAGGLRFDFVNRFLRHPRNRMYLSAWHQAQVFCDPAGIEKPIGIQIKAQSDQSAIHHSLAYNSKEVVMPNFQPIQYWSQGTPPLEVYDLTERWNILLKDLLMPPIERFSRAMAREWINEYAPEYSISFDTAFHYSVESDVFRIAYASKHDCLYLDSDLWPHSWTSQSLKTLLNLNSTVLYLRAYRPTISGCFFLSRVNCKFMRSLTRRCREINLSRLPRNARTVMNVFGPDKFTHCLRYELSKGPHTARIEKLQPGIVKLTSSLLDVALANEHIIAAGAPPDGLAYKKTTLQWQIYLGQSS